MTLTNVSSKLHKLNTLELYAHHAGLTRSLDLLTPESKEIALAELEATANLASEKIDGLHYYIKQNESLIAIGNEEKALLDATIKHHQSQIDSTKALLKELRRRGFATDNTISGKRYAFKVSPLSTNKVEITSNVEDWSPEDQAKYAMFKEVTTTTVYKDINGEDILRSDQKVKRERVPNPDAIQSAYESGKALPPGVTVKPSYRITTKRILQNND